MVNQTAFVEMSLLEIISTTISSTASIPLLHSSTTVPNPTSETASEEESPDSSSPTYPPSMFSTSMAPPQLTHQEEELITTAAPTIKEEHEETDDLTDLDFDDFMHENITTVDFVPQRGDAFPEPQNTQESTGATESMSKPINEPDDHSVIEINTIQPDVAISDASLITEPMFAEGKTEETIMDSGITTGMASDLTDLLTESTEMTSSEEVLSSSESTPSTSWLHSTPFPDYDPSYDDIETDSFVEGLPPNQDMDTTRSPQTTSTSTQTTPQAQDVDMPNVVYVEGTTSTAARATTVLIDSGTSAEDVTLSTSVHIFDESATQLPEHSGDALMEDNIATEMGAEFFTSTPLVSAVAGKPTSSDEQSIQVTTVMQIQNVSGKT